jgi:FkbM family methyltransferase
MSIWEGIQSHHRLFGLRGIFLVTKCRYLKRPMEIQVKAANIHQPMWLRMRTTDASVFEEIILNEEYLVERSLSPKVIVDAGANIGLTSIYFANKYPEARIFSIEPEAGNFRMLVKNAAPYPQITPIQAALWKDSTPLELSNPGDGNWGFQTRERGNSDSTTVSVPAITIDSLLKQFDLPSIDLLKVDIEGAEKEVFADSSGWIDRIGGIMVELHDRYKPGCSETVLAATRDFSVKWQKGETSFLFRNGPSSALPSAGAQASQDQSARERKSGRGSKKTRILSTQS